MIYQVIFCPHSYIFTKSYILFSTEDKSEALDFAYKIYDSRAKTDQCDDSPECEYKRTQYCSQQMGTYTLKVIKISNRDL